MTFRMPRLAALSAATLAVALLLTGCFTETPAITPAPEPAVAPVFASDEEALAAAVEAYEAYVEMSDLIAEEGGENPDRIREFATGEALETDLKSFERLRSEKRSLVGETIVYLPVLQQYWTDHDTEKTSVVAYFCVDYSDARSRDENGTETPTGAGIFRFEVGLESSEVPSSLRVARIEPWASSACH